LDVWSESPMWRTRSPSLGSSSVSARLQITLDYEDAGLGLGPRPGPGLEAAQEGRDLRVLEIPLPEDWLGLLDTAGGEGGRVTQFAVHLEHLLPDEGYPVGGGWPVDEPLLGLVLLLVIPLSQAGSGVAWEAVPPLVVVARSKVVAEGWS